MFFFSHEVQGDYGNLGILQLSLLYHAVQHSLEQIVDISGPAGTARLGLHEGDLLRIPFPAFQIFQELCKDQYRRIAIVVTDIAKCQSAVLHRVL